MAYTHSNPRGDDMLLWQRLLITLATMLLMSFVASLLWHWLFNTEIPSYLSGVVGGVTAIPIWEILKKKRRQLTQSRCFRTR